jgi:hypothetical protein
MPQFDYVDQRSIEWDIPDGYTGTLHLCAAEAGGRKCRATFVFSDENLQRQIEDYGPDLYADLARANGIALTFDAGTGGFELTVTNVIDPNAGDVTVRVECWDPDGNAIAHKFVVPAGVKKGRVREVVYG